jgi:hypothetical protein
MDSLWTDTLWSDPLWTPLGATEGEPMTTVLALKTSGSTIIAMHFLHKESKARGKRPSRKVLRLLVLQRNGTFLVWEWRRTHKRGDTGAASSYKWLFVARVTLPPSTAPGPEQPARSILQAVVSSSHGHIVWLEASASKTCRVYAVEVPWLLASRGEHEVSL